MFARFQAAVLLVTLTAVSGSALERAILDYRREIGRQNYRMDELRERIARARLQTEHSTARTLPSRPAENGRLEPPPVLAAEPSERAVGPVLHWRSSVEDR